MRIEISTATPVPEQRGIVVVGAFPWYVWQSEEGREGGRGRKDAWSNGLSTVHTLTTKED